MQWMLDSLVIRQHGPSVLFLVFARNCFFLKVNLPKADIYRTTLTNSPTVIFPTSN